MNYESNRLRTFSNWPSSAVVDPQRIAKAGFFYTGQGVEVQCFSCGGKISEWSYGDQVMTRHRRLDGNCPFVVDPLNSGNITVDESPDYDLPSPNSPMESIDLIHDYGVTSEDEMYKSDALRLLSFVNWNDSSVSRESLVNAGFYHAGEGRLRCAWCGGELAETRRLGSLGDPLEVHLRYFPGCSHAEAVAARLARQAADIPSPASPRLSPPPAPDRVDNHTQTPGAVHNARVLAAEGGSGGAGWRALGVVGGSARHAHMASAAARLATFDMWPPNRDQTPAALADAGFFYTGDADQVRCFYCDGGLGRWEAGDAPWREHAKWFPHCGYLRLVKGQEFIEECKESNGSQRTVSTEASSNMRSPHIGVDNRVHFPVNDNQVTEEMEGPAAMAALGAGLDAARVRRAIVRRLRATGQRYTTSEALIDAVLNEQLGEEPWPDCSGQRLARDILRDLAPIAGLLPSTTWENRPDSQQSNSTTNSSSPCTPPGPANKQTDKEADKQADIDNRNDEKSPSPERMISLEEENRQLKEARLCKVCMDGEVSVVFLPCGHLVSCARCGAGLYACPLCRGHVTALVRAYLA